MRAPAFVLVLYVTRRNADLRERKFRFAARTLFQLEGDDGIDFPRPIPATPRLHDQLRRNNFQIHALDVTAITGERAARLAADFRGRAGELAVLALVHQSLKNFVRRSVKDNVMFDFFGHESGFNAGL